VPRNGRTISTTLGRQLLSREDLEHVPIHIGTDGSNAANATDPAMDRDSVRRLGSCVPTSSRRLAHNDPTKPGERDPRMVVVGASNFELHA
jgi:hypothetical protein